MSNHIENSTGSNQDDPFAHFHESIAKDQELKGMITRKALDLPKESDPMHIDNSRHFYNQPEPANQPKPSLWAGIAKAALLASGVGAAGWILKPSLESHTPTTDTNTHYELRFDD